MGHDYIGHDKKGHAYIEHNCIGQDYMPTMGQSRHLTYVVMAI